MTKPGHENRSRESPTLHELRQVLENPTRGHQEIQELRQRFDPALFEQVEVATGDQALERGIDTVRSLFQGLRRLGIEYRQIAPGHGIGHIARDYVNALRLAREGKDTYDPRHLFVGFVGGMMHDIGCAVVPRYREKDTPVRHAEAGALLLKPLLAQLPVNPAEQTVLQYAVAANTHYLAPQDITTTTGEKFITEPYPDVDAEGKPLLGVWLPRWIDRLDCSGPTFPGRHFLTMLEPHKDFDSGEHFEVRFHDHMQPLLRERSQRRQPPTTMLEHLHVFATSQTNASPYGQYDSGPMVALRDAQRERLLNIIQVVERAAATGQGVSATAEQTTLEQWQSYLQRNIEPTALGAQGTRKLLERFRELEAPTRAAWILGYQELMRQYLDWADDTLVFLKTVPSDQHKFEATGVFIERIVTPTKALRVFVERLPLA